MMDHRCPTCGASMKMYWHRLTPGLVSALFKLLQAVRYYGRNSVHLHDELKVKGSPFCLSDFEWNNFTKLRFHGLAAKVDGEPGKWLITHRGAQFLKGEIAVPVKVRTFRNKVTDHSEEMITIGEMKRKEPHFEQLPDFDVMVPETQPGNRQTVLP